MYRLKSWTRLPLELNAVIVNPILYHPAFAYVTPPPSAFPLPSEPYLP